MKPLSERKRNVRSAYWKKKADFALGQWAHNTYTECAVNNDDCCGKLEAHHLISRSISATRHCKENIIMLCSLHHKYSNELSPHKGPIGFAQWLRKNREEQFNWALDNKWVGGKPDYKKAYEELI